MRSRSIVQYLSTSLLMVFGFTLFAFAPISQAANPLIQNVTLTVDPLVIGIPGFFSLGSEPKISINYDYDTGGYSTGAVLEQILDSNDNVVYEFGNVGTDDKATGPYHLEWDGKYKNGGLSDGNFVPNGTYTVYISSLTPTPPAAEFKKSFVVENAVMPELSLVNNPPPVYYTPSGDYGINYAVEFHSSKTADVRLTIRGPLNNNPQDEVISSSFVTLTDGNYVVNWNGKMNGNPAPVGQYTYELGIQGFANGFSLLSNKISGQFTVSDQTNPQPVLKNLNVSPNPYDPSKGLVTLSYDLESSLGNTSTFAQVYNSSDVNNILKEWTFTSQGNGSNSVTWDGKNTSGAFVADGAYVFKVWGTDGSVTLLPQQTSFTIAVNGNPSPSGQCAGYTDVAKTDSDCAAIEYVQTIGAMTGNPDGTFAPNEILQRDQVAKISLETFGLFDSSADYCSGTAAFPDVSSSAWSYQYICRGVDLGMITGYKSGQDAGKYIPARSVNRVEFLALILRNLGESMPSNSSTSYNDVATGEWFTGYAKYAYDHSLFVGNKLEPTKFVSRREVAEVLYGLHNQGKI